MIKVILASKSPYRKALLSRLGIPFECKDSEVDESLLKSKISAPAELSEQLSLQKALKVQENNPDALVIGSDQVCHFNNQILGKAGNLKNAFTQLTKLQGQTHRLITSYAIVLGEQKVIKTVVTELTMIPLNFLQINKYLSTDNPIDCAGSYKLELNGISLFSEIKTVDQSAIIGLPLIELNKDLNQMGLVIPPEH